MNKKGPDYYSDPLRNEFSENERSGASSGNAAQTHDGEGRATIRCRIALNIKRGLYGLIGLRTVDLAVPQRRIGKDKRITIAAIINSFDDNQPCVPAIHA